MQHKSIIFTVLAAAATLIHAAPVPITGGVLPGTTTPGSTGTGAPQADIPIRVDPDNVAGTKINAPVTITGGVTMDQNGEIAVTVTPDTPVGVVTVGTAELGKIETENQ